MSRTHQQSETTSGALVVLAMVYAATLTGCYIPPGSCDAKNGPYEQTVEVSGGDCREDLVAEAEGTYEVMIDTHHNPCGDFSRQRVEKESVDGLGECTIVSDFDGETREKVGPVDEGRSSVTIVCRENDVGDETYRCEAPLQVEYTYIPANQQE